MLRGNIQKTNTCFFWIMQRVNHESFPIKPWKFIQKVNRVNFDFMLLVKRCNHSFSLWTATYQKLVFGILTSNQQLSFSKHTVCTRLSTTAIFPCMLQEDAPDHQVCCGGLLNGGKREEAQRKTEKWGQERNRAPCGAWHLSNGLLLQPLLACVD